MNKEVTIPTSLHEITLDSYVKLISIDVENDSDVIYKSMNAIFGFDRVVVDAMSQKSVDQLANKIGVMTAKEYEPMYKFKIGKTWYGMIPDFTEEVVKFGEFADSSKYINQILDDTLDPQSYQRFMAVLFRPIIKEENGLIELEPYNGTQLHYEAMAKAPASAFKGAESFFLSLRKALLRYSQTYIRRGGAQEVQTLVKHLEKSTDGMEVLGTLQNLSRMT